MHQQRLSSMVLYVWFLSFSTVFLCVLWSSVACSLFGTSVCLVSFGLVFFFFFFFACLRCACQSHENFIACFTCVLTFSHYPYSKCGRKTEQRTQRLCASSVATMDADIDLCTFCLRLFFLSIRSTSFDLVPFGAVGYLFVRHHRRRRRQYQHCVFL